jgi:Trk K+ transport system NAD-binding subunit
MRVEEFQVPKNSGFIGRTLLDVHQETGVLAISAKCPGSEDYDYNPDPLMKLAADMVLIFITTPDKRILLEEKLSRR